MDEDRLDSISGPGVAVGYTYDADGRKVKETTTDTVRQFLVDRLLPYGQVILETDGAGDMVTEYTYGHERISQERDGVTHWYLADGQGSVRHLADSNGFVSDTYAYTAFGEPLASTGSTANDFKYVGEEADPNSGFYYLRARWMDPGTGRFASVDPYAGDPAFPITQHRYLYSGNSPITYTDPSGEIFGIPSLTINSILQGVGRAFAATRYLNLIDKAYTAIDLVANIRNVLTEVYNFSEMSSASVSSAGASYDMRKLQALGPEHAGGVVSRVAADIPQIVTKIKNNHQTLMSKVSRNPSSASILFYPPSLPGGFSSGPRIRIPLRIGRFRVQIVPTSGGGSFFGIGFRAPGMQSQVFRVDYHGKRKGNEPDATYFQVAPRILGESFDPWFHYHTPRRLDKNVEERQSA